MLKLIGSLVISGLLLVACGSSSKIPAGAEIQTNEGSSYDVYTWHDSSKNVTCWILSVNTTYGGRGGISCITDHELAQ